MTMPLSLDEIDTAEKLADWFARGGGDSRAALALLVEEYGDDGAEQIWLRGNQIADELGVR